MIRIQNLQEVEAKLGRWHPSDLAFIDKLEFGPGREPYQASLLLVGLFQRRDKVPNGWPSATEAYYKITLLFDNIKNLHLHEFNNSPQQIMGFDIHDIANRQWEGIKFEVADYEDQRLSFQCEAIICLEVEAIEPERASTVSELLYDC